MRRVILKAHLFLALFAGAFLMLLGVTGSILAFEPELDRLFHPHLSYIKTGNQVLSLSEMGEAVSRRFAGEPVVAYLPSSSPDLSSQVVLPSGIAYVNQHTGEVLGMRERGQTFLGYVRALHVRLALGNVGKNILRWAAVAMLFSLASGLYLWWPVKQVRIPGNWHSRRFWFDVHNAVGILAFLFLGLLAATGTVIGFEDQLAPLIYKLTSSAPMQTNYAAIPEPVPGALAITPDQAVAIGRTRIPAAVPYRVQMPKYGGLYQVALQFPGDSVAGDRNVVAIDLYGNVVSVIQSSNLSAGEKVLEFNEALHTGGILGMPGRLLASFASVMLIVQVLSGLLLWLRRTRNAVPASRPTKEQFES